MNFLQKIKQWFENKSMYWAANYPKAWSLGWLTQLCIGVVMYLLSALVGFILPIDTINTPDVVSWYSLSYIPAVLWMLFIIYRLVKYNLEKLYGDRTILHNFIELPTYFIQLSLPLLIPFIIGSILTFRVASLVDDDSLSQYAIAFEKAEPFFTFNFGKGNFVYEAGHHYYYDYSYSIYRYFETPEEYYRSILSTKLQDELDETLYIEGDVDDYGFDSLSVYRINMRDSIGFHKGVFKESRPMLYPYTFYHFYNFEFNYKEFVPNVNIENNKIQEDSIKQIYFYNHFKDQRFIRERFNTLLSNMNEFGIEVDEVYTDIELLNLYQNHIYYAKEDSLQKKVEKFDSKTYLYKEQILYIKDCKEKYFFFFYDGKMYNILVGIIFGLTLLLSLFKNMNWIEFLVGLFFVSVLPLSLGVFMSITRWDKEVVILSFWSIFIMVVIWSVIEKKKIIRSKKGAVLMMIIHLCVAYLPVAILFTLDKVFDFWHWSYFDRYLIKSPNIYYPDAVSYHNSYWYLYENAYGWAVFSGYLIYFFILYPLWIKTGWLNFVAKPKKS